MTLVGVVLGVALAVCVRGAGDEGPGLTGLAVGVLCNCTKHFNYTLHTNHFNKSQVCSTGGGGGGER